MKTLCLVFGLLVFGAAGALAATLPAVESPYVFTDGRARLLHISPARVNTMAACR